MTLHEASFSSPRELVKFVNDSIIAQEDIVTIRPWNGQWYIFYYA